MRGLLLLKPGYSLAKRTLEAGTFSRLPSTITEDFANSFLLLGINHCKHTDFPVAISNIVAFLGVHKVPSCLIPPYQEFFKTFNPGEWELTVELAQTLKVLLQLTIAIGAEVSWVAHLENPAVVLIEPSWLVTDDQINLSTILSNERAFFSAEYFAMIPLIIKDSYCCLCIMKGVENCF